MRIVRALLIPVCVILLVGAAGATIYTFIENNPPVPSFSSSLSDKGWWVSDNTNVQAMARDLGTGYTGEEPIDKLPVADMTIHHGEKDSGKAPEDSCFVSFSYFNYALADVEAAHATYKDRKNVQGEASPLEPVTATLATFEGDKEYQLRRYTYAIEGQDILSGYQVGFIPINEGYIRTEGVCKTHEDLELLTPIIETVTLRKR